jgi:CheY-like chemotaxis protein
MDVSKNLPPITAKATQIHQVLMNLCVNARDAMPNGGTITIKAERIIIDELYARIHIDAKTGPYIVISVTDQGIGIPPENIDRIFEPFFTTKEVGMGTGLGLYTVYSIIKSHNGFLKVHSEVGKGTTFDIYLPIQEVTETAVTEEKAELPLGNGELILLVEDENSIREITKTALETFGYSVIDAIDGTEAIVAYATHREKIALVVTDMMMPIMDGASTIRAIQQLNPKAKFIAVSGSKQDEKIADQETVTFLQKPYTSEKLLKIVGAMLQQK